jgi:hypothetical protein
VTVLIDDTDNRQSHRCYSLTVFALDPRRREALITLLPVLPELEKRRTWVGWGVLEWCNGVLDSGGAAAGKGGRAKIRSDLDDKHLPSESLRNRFLSEIWHHCHEAQGLMAQFRASSKTCIINELPVAI